MLKTFLKHFIFTVKTSLYMCDVIQYNNNFKSLRKRWLKLLFFFRKKAASPPDFGGRRPAENNKFFVKLGGPAKKI